VKRGGGGNNVRTTNEIDRERERERKEREREREKERERDCITDSTTLHMRETTSSFQN
jgi:hypothetical protein